MVSDRAGMAKESVEVEGCQGEASLCQRKRLRLALDLL